ncbi:MAG: 3-oxoacyl-(acyl-carrier-protein) reductase [Thermoleophilia bacterium]|nr:3-oxoacyl-(acyl-carrier-protein) reductase [Thermoleophilia bacterium]
MTNTLPPQHQDRQPGIEAEMHPRPKYAAEWYRGSGKLTGKRALITGGDSGIGRAVAVLFAREGADVAIAYLDEETDAAETKRLVEAEGRTCHTFSGDLAEVAWCEQLVTQAADALGGLDILVNNAAEQHVDTDFEDITPEQVERTFRTNILAMFHVTRTALKHLSEGSTIINTTSVTNYKGKPELVDYATTKGAITSFTRSLSGQLVERGIRVNGVAPGPIWTPLIPASFSEEEVAKFGQDVPMQRPGQPEELAPAYVYLASQDSSYVTGQVIHVNGGTVVNG